MFYCVLISLGSCLCYGYPVISSVARAKLNQKNKVYVHKTSAIVTTYKQSLQQRTVEVQKLDIGSSQVKVRQHINYLIKS